MTKYTFKPEERPKKFIDINVGGVQSRKVPAVAFVAFTTKAEVTHYSQARLIEGKKCRVSEQPVKGKKWYVPFIYPPIE
jgi:hypothetical protein